jgi:hypothetical protein
MHIPPILKKQNETNALLDNLFICGSFYSCLLATELASLTHLRFDSRDLLLSSEPPRRQDAARMGVMLPKYAEYKKAMVRVAATQTPDAAELRSGDLSLHSRFAHEGEVQVRQSPQEGPAISE